MSRNVNLGFDNHYNRRLQDIISEMENMDVLIHQPQLFGGGPLRERILPSGELGHYPPIQLLAEASEAGISGGKMHGGINRYKKASKWLGFTTKALSSGLDLASKAKALSGRGLEEDARKVVRKAKKMVKEPLVQEIVSVLRKSPVVKQAVKKVKAVVGGGRGARAQLVKAVMAKHGMKMIDASKFIKANNMY